MKTMLTILAAIALVAAPAMGATLYEQESTAQDGPAGIDASGQGPANANSTNWKYQYGGGSSISIYSGSEGELVVSETGDINLEVEADIEMYIAQTIANNKIYFHLGDPYNASNADKTAYVQGTLTSNNGQYIGINFTGQNKTAADFEKDGGGNWTGVILGGMQSDNDTFRSQDNQMDIQILMNWGSGFLPPDNYGDGSHDTIHDALWWLVANGATGTFNYQWQVKLLPTPNQPDGDYCLDPLVVAAPVL